MSTIRSMINAARAGNAVEFEKSFVSETQERLSSALADRHTQVVASMFGLSENVDLTEEDLDAIYTILEDLTQEDLDIISEMDETEAFELISNLVAEDTNKVAAKRGAVSGAAKGALAGATYGAVAGGPVGAAVGAVGGAVAGGAAGAVRHVADRVIHKGVNKVGRGVKKVAQKVGIAKKAA